MKAALVVMGRIPRPGQVKTRLCPPLVPAEAALLYRAFLDDVCALALAVSEVEPIFSCALGAGETLDELPVPAAFRRVAQAGGDLGARIADAVRQAARPQVVIIGSDAPLMAPDRIRAALAGLADPDCDAVFGPTEDGGYDLIGLRRVIPALLEGIPWSTPEVMATTRAAARAGGLRWRELALGADIDTFADLLRDQRRLRNDPRCAPATHRALTELGQKRPELGFEVD